MYKFRTIAIIGDGNHALFDKFCGYSGKFGIDAVPDGDFLMFLLPSPIHLWVQSMVHFPQSKQLPPLTCSQWIILVCWRALFNSGVNLTKQFCKRGEMAVIPRMKANYIFHDSWIRFNKTPAKIVQVCSFKSHSYLFMKQAVMAEIQIQLDSEFILTSRTGI